MKDRVVQVVTGAATHMNSAVAQSNIQNFQKIRAHSKEYGFYLPNNFLLRQLYKETWDGEQVKMTFAVTVSSGTIAAEDQTMTGMQNWEDKMRCFAWELTPGWNTYRNQH